MDNLSGIKAGYFEIVRRHVGGFYRPLEAPDPLAMARRAFDDPHLRSQAATACENMCLELGEYWGARVWHAHELLFKQDAIKGVYTGRSFLTPDTKTVSTSAIYTDTTIVFEPITRTETAMAGANPANRAFNILLMSLLVLSFEYLTDDTDGHPIIYILPGLIQFEGEYADFLKFTAVNDGLSLLGDVFGETFENGAHLRHYAASIKSIDQLKANVRNPNLVALPETGSGSLDRQLSYLQGLYPAEFDRDPISTFIDTIGGKAAQAADTVARSRSLGGTPLMDVQGVWIYFNWKLRNEAESLDGVPLVHAHTLRGLGEQAGDLAWLGNVPMRALIEIRKHGALGELREILSTGVSEIASLDPANFEESSNRVANNIRNALVLHRQSLNDLSKKKWKFAGVELGSCLVYGTVELAAACGIPFVSLINTFLEQTTGTPKIKEIPAKYRILKGEANRVQNSPAGLLFNLRRAASRP